MRFFRYVVHKLVPIQNASDQRKGITEPKTDRISSKVNQFIYTLVCNNICQILAPYLSSSDIFFTRLFRYSQKRGITPE